MTTLVSARDHSHITSTWVARPHPNPAARLRLFCLPYAGGGTTIFQPWTNSLHAEIELCLIRLPGREGRLSEAPYERLDCLVEAIASAILPLLDRPFALFGHSMGAMLGFELARRLRHQKVAPVHLFVAGRNAPHVPDLTPRLSHLPDAEFVERLQARYGGIPQVIWQDRRLMQLFLPALRADIGLLETYVYGDEPLLDFPITAFAGEQDQETSQAGLVAWRDLTRRAFDLTFFPGNHFFLQSVRQTLAPVITSHLSRYLS